MYTQCSQCQKKHPITVKELRHSEGIIHCVQCRSTFDPLEFLTEGEIPFDENSESILPEVKETTRLKPWFWLMGIVGCLILFFIQFIIFEGYNLTQNVSSRKWLESMCSTLNCQLPDYKNTQSFSIHYGSFEPVPNTDYYEFKTALTNQSPFAQKIPSIKLILIDYTGGVFAERIFTAEDFSSQNAAFIQPEGSEEITINVVSPSSKKLAGYRFKLI